MNQVVCVLYGVAAYFEEVDGRAGPQIETSIFLAILEPAVFSY